MEYEVFRRNWWRKENGKLVPDPSADCIHIEYVETEEQARAMCREYNEENEAGELSHKAEYRSI